MVSLGEHVGLVLSDCCLSFVSHRERWVRPSLRTGCSVGSSVSEVVLVGKRAGVRCPWCWREQRAAGRPTPRRAAAHWGLSLPCRRGAKGSKRTPSTGGHLLLPLAPSFRDQGYLDIEESLPQAEGWKLLVYYLDVAYTVLYINETHWLISVSKCLKSLSQFPWITYTTISTGRRWKPLLL